MLFNIPNIIYGDNISILHDNEVNKKSNNKGNNKSNYKVKKEMSK